MLPPLSLTFNLTDRLLSYAETVSGCLTSEKIKNVAINIFKGGTSTYLCLFGTYELSQGITKKTIEEKDNILNKIVNASKAYLYVHGGLLLSSGLFSLINTLQDFEILDLITMNQAMNAASNVLFLGANIVALKENFRLIHDLKETDWTKTNIDKKELHWMKQSAFFGFVSNLGYIITTASLLFNGTTAFTVIAAIFSCFCGGIKFLYDLSLWAKEQGFI